MGYKEENLEDTRQGSLTIGKPFRKDGRTYYHVKCDCGRKYDILRDNLVRKHYTHCKCRGMAIDPGRKYGMLQPIRRMEDGTWECRCDCGNTTYKKPGWLNRCNPENGINISCGCKKQANKVKIRTDNTSGIKGVSYNRRRSKWIAYINKDDRRTFLGYYATKELAADARRVAEKAMFAGDD